VNFWEKNSPADVGGGCRSPRCPRRRLVGVLFARRINSGKDRRRPLASWKLINLRGGWATMRYRLRGHSKVVRQARRLATLTTIGAPVPETDRGA